MLDTATVPNPAPVTVETVPVETPVANAEERGSWCLAFFRTAQDVTPAEKFYLADRTKTQAQDELDAHSKRRLENGRATGKTLLLTAEEALKRFRARI